MGIAPHPWLDVNIISIAGLTISPGNSIPGIIDTKHGRVTAIDKHAIVLNMLSADFTTVKAINLFPALGLCHPRMPQCEKLNAQI